MPDTCDLSAASLTVLAVDRPVAQPNGFTGNLDSPSLGEATSGPSIFFAGWAVGSDGQRIEVSIRRRDRRTLCHRFPRPDLVNLFGRTVSDEAGFFGEIWASGIDRIQELELVAEGRNGDEHPIARLSVQASRQAPSELLGISEARLKTSPGLLTVNSMGRSGSSYLMASLLRHPRIGGDGVPPYEARLVLRAALQTMFSISCARPHFYMKNAWYSDFFGTLDRPEDKESTEEMRQILVQAELSRLAHVILDYQGFLEKKSGRQIGLICEKSIGLGLTPFISWFWPRCKSIILVRDLRDMLCSYVAFDKKRGIPAFTDGLARDGDAYFAALARHGSEFISMQQNRPGETLVVRYEDLVLDRHSTLTKLFEFCEVENDAAVVDGCIDGLESDKDFLKSHATSSSPELSVGRWHSDLDDDMVAFYEKHLRAINTHFGYV
jgi:hypothetical protein